MPAEASPQRAHKIVEVKMNFFMAKAFTWGGMAGQQNFGKRAFDRPVKRHNESDDAAREQKQRRRLNPAPLFA